MLYVIRPLHGNEFRIIDDNYDELIAVFFSEQDAIDYVNFKTNKQDEKYTHITNGQTK